jgi:hypothetical protein
MVQFYAGPLAKVDADKRIVLGYATTVKVDSQGETIKLSAVRARSLIFFAFLP